MGNSGAALADPTAASYYNPSLLNKKIDNSYSLAGNTLGSFSSKSENKETTSFALNPSYLSSIIVGTSLVHEFFLANISPSKVKTVVTSTTASAKNRTEISRDQTQFLFGYSMAFRKVPFALSYFGQFNQISSVGFNEFTSLTSNARSTASTKSDLKSLGVGISISGHTTYENYSLGYQIRSRQLSVYKKSEGLVTTFLHGGTTSTDYSKTETENLNEQVEELGSSFIVGHGFKLGDHEFITDSQFQESSDLNYTYNLTQTFGYRMNSDGGHQILCGISHKIGNEIKYFGQSAYYSVGYSWLTRANRSVLGAYVYSSKLQQDNFAAGLTFGSEFMF
ncbi:MAG: hypothetical protein H7328_08970 [Bdellovibrio sp.]|nr:hypothetical protein [Bdellovibrio sp.]